jgi:hypothetical protein
MMNLSLNCKWLYQCGVWCCFFWGITIGTVYGSEKFIVEIEVPRVSFFSIQRYYGPIKKGRNRLGYITFKNNTRDGFRLTVSTTYGGNLTYKEPGEPDSVIPYVVTIDPIERVLDNNVVEVATPDLLPGMETAFIYLTGEASQLSYGSYEIVMNVVDEYNALEMAGNYEDTLTLSYTDL